MHRRSRQQRLKVSSSAQQPPSASSKEYLSHKTLGIVGKKHNIRTFIETYVENCVLLQKLECFVAKFHLHDAQMAEAQML